jgi:hypothetical protein
MAKWIIVLSLFLSACGQDADIGTDPAATNHGYGWDYDQSGDSGLRVNYIDGAALTVDFSIIESWYLAAQKCTGIAASGPLIAVTAQQIVNPEGKVVNGLTYFDTGLIVMTENVISPANIEYLLKHETIHYLLWASGFPNDRNTTHDSPYFSNPNTNAIGCE